MATSRRLSSYPAALLHTRVSLPPWLRKGHKLGEKICHGPDLTCASQLEMLQVPRTRN